MILVCGSGENWDLEMASHIHWTKREQTTNRGRVGIDWGRVRHGVVLQSGVSQNWIRETGGKKKHTSPASSSDTGVI